MHFSNLRWVALTHAHEIPYNSRSLVLGFYLCSIVLVSLLIVLNMALVGYDTKLVLQKNPNITQYDHSWTLGHFPAILRIMTHVGDCEVGKLNQDVTLKTNSSLPLFPYQFKNSYIFEHSGGLDGATIVTRFVDGPYQANPLSSCFVSEMGLYYEPLWQNFKAKATITCEPTDQLPRFFKFTTLYSASGLPYMRPDSTLDYFILDVHPEKTALGFERWLDQSADFAIDNTSRLNVLGALDGLAGDLMQIGLLQFDLLNDTERIAVPETAFFGWDLAQDGRGLDDNSRLELLTFSLWHTTFSETANRTMVNFMIAVRDAIHLDLGHITSDNIYLNKTAFNAYIHPNPLYLSVVEQYRTRFMGLDPDALPICTWTRGCLPHPNITWAEILREDVGKLPYNNIVLPIVEPDPAVVSVIDTTYLCPTYVRKSWGSLLVSVFSATFSMYGTIYTLFAFIAPRLDSSPIADGKDNDWVDP
ncbi:unnamed protein product [Rhizoctonia solani]|uniref:Transmembrane protein n=1 Tax=Rhizoctonia solani TaxID=456999 RepID=A0A8H2WDQ5_9AGAM|nr:unnamed protein product [Rhizoctonia solani]